MPEENEDNTIKVGRPDTRRFESQDNEGHEAVSNLAGNTRESMERVREQEAQDNSDLNKLDDR